MEFDSAGARTGGNTGNLITTLAGRIDVEPLTFCCHMDTATPCVDIQPTVVNGVIRSDGVTILGGDDKAGIKAVIYGRTAYAGLSPERGVSAIQIAARAIERMKLLRIDAETTANIHTISGGAATAMFSTHAA